LCKQLTLLSTAFFISIQTALNLSCRNMKPFKKQETNQLITEDRKKLSLGNKIVLACAEFIVLFIGALFYQESSTLDSEISGVKPTKYPLRIKIIGFLAALAAAFVLCCHQFKWSFKY
jgi:hypothetical protein